MSTVFDIITDAQIDFMQPDGKLYVKGAEAIIPALRDYTTHLTSRGALVTYDTHIPEIYAASEEAKQFPLHCEDGSHGWQLVINPLTIPVPVYALYKGVFDMWQERGIQVFQFPQRETGIDREAFFEMLKEQGVTTIRVTGVAADYCVKQVIMGALARGFDVEVVERLTAGIERTMAEVVAAEFPEVKLV